MKKNCHNCIHGHPDCDYDELSQEPMEYFVCDKRDIDEVKGLEENLCRPKYLEAAKRCCELPDKTKPLNTTLNDGDLICGDSLF
tara:strand:+ start:256 stop:507 length:252 start_codon:yes stop_codon:yes gene_type:complete